MAAADGTRWDVRHANAVVAAPAPPDALVAAGSSPTDRDGTGQTRQVTLLDLFPTSGRALDVACGIGAQTAWLAARGLDVTAIDASPVAIERTQQAADDAGVRQRLDAHCLDLDAGIPVDLGTFDAIVCQRFRSPDLYDSFVERLRPGGVAVVTVLSQTGADTPGTFHAPPHELLNAFTRPDAELLFHREADAQESVIVQRPANPFS